MAFANSSGFDGASVAANKESKNVFSAYYSFRVFNRNKAFVKLSYALGNHFSTSAALSSAWYQAWPASSWYEVTGSAHSYGT
ncbi:hypothetical protein, partial [Hymenobacter defluvii]